MSQQKNKYFKGLSYKASGKLEEARKVFDYVAKYNFNGLVYTVVRNKAIEEIKSLPQFDLALDNTGREWQIAVAIRNENDHRNGNTDAAEKSVYQPMVDSICTHAKNNNWGLCAACN